MECNPELKPIEIHFGDIFEPPPLYPIYPITRRSDYLGDIVVALGESYCIVSPVYLVNGQEAIDPICCGTASRGHINKITGHWDLEKMLEAGKRGCCNGFITDEWETLRQSLIEASKTSAIILTVSGKA